MTSAIRSHGTPDVVREVLRSFQASPVFAFYVMGTLGVAGLIGLITFDIIDLGMSHFGDPSHRAHDVTYGFLFMTGVVGVVAQLRRPRQNLAGMLMALIPSAALLLTAALAGDFNVVERNPLRYAAWMTVVAALVHPAGRAFFRSFSVSRANWAMVALVGVAAAPLLALASTNIGLQRTADDGHAGMGHYAFVAAFSFAVIAVGLLASLRPAGWRLTAWVGGLLPALLAVTSILYPDTASSLGRVWSLAALAWGVLFVAVAERTNAADPSVPDDLIHRS